MVKHDLLKAIQNGLAQHEFVAYYQPQYDAVSGRVVSAEALARWVKADGTIVSPEAFIPFAEENGIITEIDWYILNEVCVCLKKQIEAGETVKTAACNFSRLHLKNPEFEAKMCEIVDSYGIPHKRISIEITESAMQAHDERTIQFVNHMRNLGFDVAIDDFGSGMSSMKLLHDIDASVLKIDKSLLSQNCEEEKERILLEGTIQLANRLKMKTVSEGVETEQQLGFLRTCGCTRIQGYLFAKPMPEKEYRELLVHRYEMEEDDVLLTQSSASALTLLNDAVFTRFPLVIMVNLTRDSYYMMAYEDFTQRTCAASGSFHELIEHGATTMHPDDQAEFKSVFNRENLLHEYEKGAKVVKRVTRQIGEDGQYHPVETADYFVKNPSSDDVLIIVFCQNMD